MISKSDVIKEYKEGATITTLAETHGVSTAYIYSILEDTPKRQRNKAINIPLIDYKQKTPKQLNKEYDVPIHEIMAFKRRHNLRKTKKLLTQEQRFKELCRYLFGEEYSMGKQFYKFVLDSIKFAPLNKPQKIVLQNFYIDETEGTTTRSKRYYARMKLKEFIDNQFTIQTLLEKNIIRRVI